MKITKLLYCVCLSFVATASISANIIAPAFPAIGKSFYISLAHVHWLMAIYLCGYVVGQLIYGPLANAYGRLRSLRIGFIVNLVGIGLSLLAVQVHTFNLLLFSRLVTALGASSGLVCTFILIKELFSPQQAKRAMQHVNVMFGLGIGVATMLGGMLAEHAHWVWILWVLALHGSCLLAATYLFKETFKDTVPLQLGYIFKQYMQVMRNPTLIGSAVCVGFATALNYCYATAAPSIAIHALQINVAHYGALNWINIGGMLIASILGAEILARLGAKKCLAGGLLAFLPALVSLGCMLWLRRTSIVWLFVTTAWIFAFSRMVYASGAYLATNAVSDTASAASVMSFINLLTAIVSVVVMGYLPFSSLTSFSLITGILYCIAVVMFFLQRHYTVRA